ncbi:MAG: hypothetical protein JEZ14_07490 [Marinilabiliaceae bacterium]|nr:hypothetical protein [Marinilabiliaceae bacterium]
MTDNDYKYFAFISYSHEDLKVCKQIHRKLEGYKVPKKFRGIVNEKGEQVPSKLSPIFRDRDELSASPELWLV